MVSRTYVRRRGSFCSSEPGVPSAPCPSTSARGCWRLHYCEDGVRRIGTCDRQGPVYATNGAISQRFPHRPLWDMSLDLHGK
jgi:hypothetical protein